MQAEPLITPLQNQGSQASTFLQNSSSSPFYEESLSQRPLFCQDNAPFLSSVAENGQAQAQLLLSETVFQIEIHKIRPNPSQPRSEFSEEALVALADSIKQYGILQPLTVRKLPNPEFDGVFYELVAGERRLRAAKLLGFEKVPCLLVQVDGKRSAELALIENIQRKDLNLFEEAAAIASFIDIYGYTQDQIAKRLSTSQSYIANKLRILRLSAFEKEQILRHNLTERHARALLRLEGADRTHVLQEIIAHSWNVNATEDYIEHFLEKKGQKEQAQGRKKQQRKLILKDLRLFYNTLDRAIATVRSAGVNIISSKSETEEATELLIRIPKKPLPPQKEGNSPSSQENPAQKEAKCDKIPAHLPQIRLDAPPAPFVLSAELEQTGLTQSHYESDIVDTKSRDAIESIETETIDAQSESAPHESKDTAKEPSYPAEPLHTACNTQIGYVRFPTNAPFPQSVPQAEKNPSEIGAESTLEGKNSAEAPHFDANATNKPLSQEDSAQIDSFLQRFSILP